jgi:hypothetical protein
LRKGESELFKAKNQDLICSLAAMKRAAALARQVAIQTDTAIVVFQNNQITRVTAAELRAKAGAFGETPK